MRAKSPPCRGRLTSEPTLLAPNPRLVDQWADADLVITAGGTTVYELMALGRPFAVCTVADNQTRHVDRLVDLGVALGLGSIDSLRGIHKAGLTCWERSSWTIRETRPWQRRGSPPSTAEGASGSSTGSWVKEKHRADRPSPARGAVDMSGGVTVRAATLADESTLYEWRNDPRTRIASRNRDAIPFNVHSEWLQHRPARPWKDPPDRGD